MRTDEQAEGKVKKNIKIYIGRSPTLSAENINVTACKTSPLPVTSYIIF